MDVWLFIVWAVVSIFIELVVLFFSFLFGVLFCRSGYWVLVWGGFVYLKVGMLY